jgi:hypothetical protein
MFDHGIFCRMTEGTTPFKRDTFRSFIHRKYRQRNASRLRAYHFNCSKLYKWVTRGLSAVTRAPGSYYVVFESNMGISDSFPITDTASIRVLMRRVVHRRRDHQACQITFYHNTNSQAQRAVEELRKLAPFIRLQEEKETHDC